MARPGKDIWLEKQARHLPSSFAIPFFGGHSYEVQIFVKIINFCCQTHSHCQGLVTKARRNDNNELSAGIHGS
jgi:hypothetical protein